MTPQEVAVIIAAFPGIDPAFPPWEQIQARLLAAGKWAGPFDNLSAPAVIALLDAPAAADAGPWSEPDTLTRHARTFGVDRKTLRQWIDTRRVRAKTLGSKRICIHLDDLPKSPSG